MQTTFMQACRYGQWEVVQTLLLFKENVIAFFVFMASNCQGGLFNKNFYKVTKAYNNTLSGRFVFWGEVCHEGLYFEESINNTLYAKSPKHITLMVGQPCIMKPWMVTQDASDLLLQILCLAHLTIWVYIHLLETRMIPHLRDFNLTWNFSLTWNKHL